MSEVNTIDLDALDESLIEEVVEINPDVNPMEAPPPPDDGVHRVKFIPVASGPVEVRETNNEAKTAFIQVKFSAVILAEGTKNNNKRVFAQENTLVFDGKNKLAYIIQQIRGNGSEAKQYTATLNNYVKLAKAFRAELAGEPTARLKTKWVAQRKIVGGGKNGKDAYETVLEGQKNFPLVDPKDASKGHRHIVFDKKSGQEVSAQAVIQDYFPDQA